MTLVFFDSTLLIDYLLRVEPAKAIINTYPKAGISAVAWMETLVKDVDTPNESKTRQFLGLFHKYEVTAAIQERAIRVRRNLRLKLPDAIIYATAQEHDALLITRNAKDFDPTDPLISIPYTL